MGGGRGGAKPNEFAITGRANQSVLVMMAVSFRSGGQVVGEILAVAAGNGICMAWTVIRGRD